ncbi:YtoQ family protein [Methyloprofundus sedimenti]
MYYTIYLSGGIHSDWRKRIKQGIDQLNLNIRINY